MPKIKLALLGTGHMAGLHAPNIKSNPDIELVAGCDVSKQIVDTYFAKNFPDLMEEHGAIAAGGKRGLSIRQARFGKVVKRETDAQCLAPWNEFP